MKYISSFLLLILFSIKNEAKIPSKINLNSVPPRIIRTCCSFGAEVGVYGVPFLKLTEVTDIKSMGYHKYLGNKKEKNGLLYTKKGGFIDIAHLRDIADITTFLYATLQQNKSKNDLSLKMGSEAGIKTLHFYNFNKLTNVDLANLAGKAAYDLSVWHEISTWNGASYIPFVPERYSSFSVEDAFSNLLGVHLGIKAILSDLPYEKAMDINLKETLSKFQAVQTYQQTLDALMQVKGVWWSNEVRYPDKDVLIKRLFKVYGCISPMLVETNDFSTETLCVPELTEQKKSLDKYYTLSIKTNYQIPLEKIFYKPSKDKIISQRDFQTLINYAQKEAAVGEVF